MGPRRVGKTVLLHHAIADRLEHGLDAKKIVLVALDRPLFNGIGLEKFIDWAKQATGADPADGGLVLFDEIQYLKGWEIHLKRLVDDYPKAKFVVSGSAAAALRLKSIESGAGRFTDFLLPPLTFYEFLRIQNREEEFLGPRDVPRSDNTTELNTALFEYMNFGGYPELLFNQQIRDNASRFVKSDIVDKVLLRDLPSLYGIQDIQELNSLFNALAYNTAGEVSLEALSQRSGVAKNTIKRYVEYLEAAFLIRVVHRVDRDGKSFQRARSFKVYLTNPSLRAALFRPVGQDEEFAGLLVETAVFAQWFHLNKPLHYARWGKGEEIDLVDLRQIGKWAVEVRWSDRAAERPAELKAKLQFAKSHELSYFTVTTRSIMKTVELDGVLVQFVPAARYCYDAGKSILLDRSEQSNRVVGAEG